VEATHLATAATRSANGAAERFEMDRKMLKLLICILGTAAIAALVLQLRQQRQELGYQNSRLHDQIRDQQARLWNQQLQIAVYTAPNAIRQTVSNHDLKMVPEAPLPRGRTYWIDVNLPGTQQRGAH
jgi:hypothetical protein